MCSSLTFLKARMKEIMQEINKLSTIKHVVLLEIEVWLSECMLNISFAKSLPCCIFCRIKF